MRFVKLYLGQGFLEILVATQAPQHWTPLEVKKPAFPNEILGYCGNLEKATHGNLRFKPELRTSGDISQRTYSYWIVGGWSRAPCASMNFTLVISTR